MVVLRAYLRQRQMLIAYAGQHVQHMQKALEQMNVKLAEVVSDVTGQTGMAIIRAILQGERDPLKLAKLRNARCKRTEAEIARYKELLSQDLVVPTVFEVWVMNADGTNKRQVTNLASASFAPFFTPDGKRLIFCTNFFDADRANRRRQPNFDLALINLDGTGIERVTFNETFDGFPMFSPDGKKLVFASNRNAAKPGDTNVFIADWID